jgi:hypothetical protein
MRIGCDLDGVLADLHTAFVKAAVELFPSLDAKAIAPADVGASPPDEEETEASEVPRADDARHVALTRRQSDAVWRRLSATPNFWETLGEHEPGAIERLARLVDEHKWEIIFITSRPYSEGRTVQRQSQRWLQRFGFPMPSVFVVHGSRGRVAEALALDLVIDDRPDNCLDVVLESKAGAVLVWRGQRTSVPSSAKRLGIGVVGSVAECLDHILAADRAEAEGTFMGRLRKLLGLATRQGAPGGRG